MGREQGEKGWGVNVSTPESKLHAMQTDTPHPVSKLWPPKAGAQIAQSGCSPGQRQEMTALGVTD
jgi:hypothetical protein